MAKPRRDVSAQDTFDKAAAEKRGDKPQAPPARRSIPLTALDLGASVQTRVALDTAHVERLREAVREGGVLPPLLVYQEGEGPYYLADGWHRREAYQQEGCARVDVLVHRGGAREALLAAAGANHEHGLPRTIADKRRAVGLLLDDPELSKLSNRAIATAARVSHPWVAQLRAERGGNVTTPKASSPVSPPPASPTPPAPQGASGLPPLTEEQAERLQASAKASGVVVYPYVCNVCGEAFETVKPYQDHREQLHGAPHIPRPAELDARPVPLPSEPDEEETEARPVKADSATADLLSLGKHQVVYLHPRSAADFDVLLPRLELTLSEDAVIYLSINPADLQRAMDLLFLPGVQYCFALAYLLTGSAHRLARLLLIAKRGNPLRPYGELMPWSEKARPPDEETAFSHLPALAADLVKVLAGAYTSSRCIAFGADAPDGWDAWPEGEA